MRHYLFFQQEFQKPLVCLRIVKHGFLYVKVKFFSLALLNAFENIVGKGENAGNQHFLLSPQCFFPFLTQISIL